MLTKLLILFALFGAGWVVYAFVVAPIRVVIRQGRVVSCRGPLSARVRADLAQVAEQYGIERLTIRGASQNGRLKVWISGTNSRAYDQIIRNVLNG